MYLTVSNTFSAPFDPCSACQPEPLPILSSSVSVDLAAVTSSSAFCTNPKPAIHCRLSPSPSSLLSVCVVFQDTTQPRP